jgi:hypothetical protein
MTFYMTSKAIPEYVLEAFGREPSELESAILADYTSSEGTGYKLNSIINKVNINNPIIIKAFTGFIEKSGNIGSFRLVDLISFNESGKKGGFVYGNVGDYILCFSAIPNDAGLSKRIFKHSVNGIYELIDRTNGIALDITGFTFEEISEKRFVFADKKKTADYVNKCKVYGITVTVLGIVTSDKKVIINREGMELADINKQLLYMNNNTAVSIDIEDKFFESYRRGFLSVFGYKFSMSASRPCTISVGAECPMPRLFAVLLGINAAAKTLNMTAVKLKFTSGSEIQIVPGNVQINIGDKIYLIRPYCDSYGIPLSDSYNNINSYLVNMNARVALRTVYPILGDIASVVNKLLGDRYKTEIDPVINCPNDEKDICSVLIVSPTQIQGKYLGTVSVKDTQENE